jgi:hypothetical protein
MVRSFKGLHYNYQIFWVLKLFTEIGVLKFCTKRFYQKSLPRPFTKSSLLKMGGAKDQKWKGQVTKSERANDPNWKGLVIENLKVW